MSITSFAELQKAGTFYLYLWQLHYFQFSSSFRMDTIPSANLRQQKLEQQRQRIEQKQKQKRETGKLIQASDLKSASSVKRGGRPLSGRRELHGYDGPMQFLHGNNPDEMTTVQVQECCDTHPHCIVHGLHPVQDFLGLFFNFLYWFLTHWHDTSREGHNLQDTGVSAQFT
jgi:hypothetical protein